MSYKISFAKKLLKQPTPILINGKWHICTCEPICYEPNPRYFTCCSDQGAHAKDETCDMWRAHQEKDLKTHQENDCRIYEDYLNHKDSCYQCIHNKL